MYGSEGSSLLLVQWHQLFSQVSQFMAPPAATFFLIVFPPSPSFLPFPPVTERSPLFSIMSTDWSLAPPCCSPATPASSAHPTSFFVQPHEPNSIFMAVLLLTNIPRTGSSFHPFLQILSLFFSFSPENLTCTFAS